jgi:hypothetical protein
MGPHKSLGIGVTHKDKILWSGKVISVQPRIRLLRSFDQRSHSYLGYVLQVHCMIGGEERTLVIGIGKGAQAKHQFRAGDFASGKSEVAPDNRTEVGEYYKTSGLRLTERQGGLGDSPPPWHGSAPELEIYRQRGHRRLDVRTYDGKCVTCIWGCRMAIVSRDLCEIFIEGKIGANLPNRI